MGKKWSSFKEYQLITESFRSYVNEESPAQRAAEPAAAAPAAPAERFFVILLGGSGTGKGALVNTNKAIGELQKLMGQSLGRPVKVGSADAIAAGEAGSRVVFEPDRVLRVHQWEQARSDFERMKKGEDPAAVFSDMPGEESLAEMILDQIAELGGIDAYKTFEDYAGRKETVGSPKTPKQALAMSDALDKFGGDGEITFAYKQMRKRPFKGGELGIKKRAVAVARKEMGEKVYQADEADSFILDSAGEDLAEQDILGELATARQGGFSTAIVLLATGAVQSFLGNMERAVARGGRNVDSKEIMTFYKILLQKHREFGRLIQRGLLDEYIVLEQDVMSPEEIEGLVRAICNPGELLDLDIPDIAGNEIDGCIPELANPDYLPDEEEAAALAGAKSVDIGDHPDSEIKNWDMAFDAAAEAGVIDDPKTAKKQAMFKGLYPMMSAARTTGAPNILRPINAKEHFKEATASIAKALRTAAAGAKMQVAEAITYKRWKDLIG